MKGNIHYLSTMVRPWWKVISITFHHGGPWWKVMVYYPLSEKKYWKIPRGVMVIPRKNIGFSSEEPKAPRKKIQYFSEGLPSTPSGIFQYFFSDKG